jgi:hypothetical protein
MDDKDGDLEELDSIPYDTDTLAMILDTKDMIKKEQTKLKNILDKKKKVLATKEEQKALVELAASLVKLASAERLWIAANPPSKLSDEDLAKQAKEVLEKLGYKLIKKRKPGSSLVTDNEGEDNGPQD